MKNPGYSNKVRIIGGHWRSRLVTVIDQPGLRPTQDRVRETLFNWVQTYLPQANCLDVFAGSGVLGLEAASRGAKFVQFIEFSQKAFVNFQTNLKNLQPGPVGCEIQITRADALNWLENHDLTRFDVIFVDPPFDNEVLLQNALKILGKVNFQTHSPIIYVESSSKVPDDVIIESLGNWQIERQLIAGAVKANLFKAKA